MRYVAVIKGEHDDFGAFFPDVIGTVGAGSAAEAAPEQLVTLSEDASPVVLEAQHTLSMAESQRDIGTHLLDSPTVNIVTGLAEDIHVQANRTALQRQRRGGHHEACAG